ncbi:twin-arginine translocation signal domain-containing protein [Bradyrhizobium elkanii]|uniref:twin-arginine translocation signal domain-containing protein n=1 Tax=Bradyrhizobium elkanii TaxID=29448 RepID=UPI00209F245B|nr:twin-arginine translocation signal domain-containing protein [Bradyrhizobium elkanii]MCP1969770.1 hypothetical protein [Bradyrhizobium elkanii]MCS4108722.1 hypothetical protein [Bradyrhizobium elkanii]
MQANAHNTTSRRQFLAGTAAALAGAPALAEAAQQDDPVFALISAHRAVAKQYAEAAADLSRREQTLIDEGAGCYPFVAIAIAGRPVLAHRHEQIDTYPISDLQRQKAHAGLDAALSRYTEVMGDAEEITRAADDAAFEALDRLLTAPISVAGVRALVGYLAEEVDPVMLRTNQQIETLLLSIQDALGSEVRA